MNSLILLTLIVIVSGTTAFIPHPAINWVGQGGDGLTHTEITQLGFIRALARFFIETRLKDKDKVDIANFTATHSIRSLFKLVYPEVNWISMEAHLFKFGRTVDFMLIHNVNVDLFSLKNIPSAHFDAELFAASNRRIMNLRKEIINNVKGPKQNLWTACGQIGELLHTLQDFYTHSNWVEMGKTDINRHIGLQENIGAVVDRNQPTCLRSGCQKITSVGDKLVGICPLQYYDCRDNIVPEVNEKGLLTSGYVSGQYDENKQPVVKPTDVDKCSHGSIFDKSAHDIPVGGINKDANNPAYAPHFYLHKDAAKLAVEATDHFFDTLRKDLGNQHFDQLFGITPSGAKYDMDVLPMQSQERLRFLMWGVSIGLDKDSFDFDNLVSQRNGIIAAVAYGYNDFDLPTFSTAGLVDDTFSYNINVETLSARHEQNSHKRHFHHHRF